MSLSLNMISNKVLATNLISKVSLAIALSLSGVATVSAENTEADTQNQAKK